jgi:hypothetical protein
VMLIPYINIGPNIVRTHFGDYNAFVTISEVIITRNNCIISDKLILNVLKD